MSQTITYRITSADLELGVIEVDLFMPDSSIAKVTVPVISVAASDDDTPTQIAVAISSFMREAYNRLNPPPVPAPAALASLVGQELQVEL